MLNLLNLLKVQVKIDYSINAIKSGEPESFPSKYGIYYRKNIFHKWHQHSVYDKLGAAKITAANLKNKLTDTLPIYIE